MERYGTIREDTQVMDGKIKDKRDMMSETERRLQDTEDLKETDFCEYLCGLPTEVKGPVPRFIQIERGWDSKKRRLTVVRLSTLRECHAKSQDSSHVNLTLEASQARYGKDTFTIWNDGAGKGTADESLFDFEATGLSLSSVPSPETHTFPKERDTSIPKTKIQTRVSLKLVFALCAVVARSGKFPNFVSFSKSLVPPFV